MEFKDRFLNNYTEQDKLLGEYKSLVDEFSQSDLQKENGTLKKQLTQLDEHFEKLKKEHQLLSEDNRKVKMALTEQIFDEKTRILKLSRSKIQTYFKKTEQSENRLLDLENVLFKKVETLSSMIDKITGKERSELLQELETLSQKIAQRLEIEKDLIDREKKSFNETLDENYKALHSEEISPEVIEKRKKQNKWELKIGLDVFNKLGIFLILIAIGVSAIQSYETWFNDYIRGSLFFFEGILMLLLGEFFHRKQNDVFSLGLIGGGIAALYSATFFSYFALGIIDMNMGLVLSVLVTVLAIVLSIRYNSKIIASFALVGGFIPFLTYSYKIGLDGAAIYAGMGYLFLLNLSLLLISTKKSWKVTNYVSFFLNLPCLIYLVGLSETALAPILFTALTFLMYLAITLIYPLKYKIRLKPLDIILLALNTISSCGLIYYLMEVNNWENMRGALALMFALVYAGLTYLIKVKLSKERESEVLFYGTAITFIILVIPFQFGVDWLSMGWLVEGVVLSVLGFQFKAKRIERAGWAIMSFSVLTFFLSDIYGGLMEFKYSMVTLALIILMVNYLVALKKEIIKPFSKGAKGVKIYKIATIVFFYLYALSMTNIYYDLFAQLPSVKPYLPRLMGDFYQGIVLAFLHISLSVILPRIKLIRDDAIIFISKALNIIALIICLVLTLNGSVLNTTMAANTAMNYLSISMLVLFNIYSLFRLKDIVLSIIDRNKFSLEFFPLVLSTYLMGVVLSLVIKQLHLGNINLIISFILLAFAIGNIVYGYLKKYSYIRLFGLALSLFSTGKFFLWDLSHLSTGAKVIAYSSFGLVLILISFIYQKINKELDVKYDS